MLRTAESESAKQRISARIEEVNEDITWEFLFYLEGAEAFLDLAEFPSNQYKYRAMI